MSNHGGAVPFEILYEDNHLLVINKPAMLPTMGVTGDRPSLISQAKDYIKCKYEKPGNVYLGVVSRLDAPVTGVVLVARTSKAAARLNRQFRDRNVDKVYWALVAGTPVQSSGRCHDWLRKDERHRKMVVSRQDGVGALEARLHYHVVCHQAETSLLEIRLETGRKHQIRVQLAALGHSVVGDRKYGNREAFPRGIALHSRRLVLTHPVRGERLEFVAPLPPSWKKSLPGLREL